MAPLDALAQARIRSLEIAVMWLMSQNIAVDGGKAFFDEVSQNPSYLLEFTEKLLGDNEEEDA